MHVKFIAISLEEFMEITTIIKANFTHFYREKKTVVIHGIFNVKSFLKNSSNSKTGKIRCGLKLKSSKIYKKGRSKVKTQRRKKIGIS